MQPLSDDTRKAQLAKELPPLPSGPTMRRSTSVDVCLSAQQQLPKAPTSAWRGAQIRYSLPPNQNPREIAIHLIGMERTPSPQPQSQSPSPPPRPILPALEELIPRHRSTTLATQKYFPATMSAADFFTYLEVNKVQLENVIPSIYQEIKARPNADELLRYFLVKAAEATNKELPFREKVPGLTFYYFRLQELIDQKYEELFFAKTCYQVVLDTMPNDRLPNSPPPSPETPELQRAKETFLQRLAQYMTKMTSPLDRAIKNHCVFLNETIRKAGFDKVVPEALVMNIFFLRCVNPEILHMSTLLSKNAQYKAIADHMKCICIRLQKDFNKLGIDEIRANNSLMTIMKSLLQPL